REERGIGPHSGYSTGRGEVASRPKRTIHSLGDLVGSGSVSGWPTSRPEPASNRAHLSSCGPSLSKPSRLCAATRVTSATSFPRLLFQRTVHRGSALRGASFVSFRLQAVQCPQYAGPPHLASS